MKQRHESKQKEPQLSIKNKAWRRIALVVGPLLLATACAGGNGQESAKAHVKQAEISAPARNTEKADKDVEAARASVEKQAVEAANSVLDILANPDAGGEEYQGVSVGNKRIIIGPDRDYPTADDVAYRRFPEIFATFNTETSQIYIQAVQAQNPETETPSFWSVTTTFAVKPGNPILGNTSQLTIDNFREALADEGTIDLVFAGAQVGSMWDGVREHGYQAGISFDKKGAREALTGLTPFDTDTLITGGEKLAGLATQVNIALGEAAAQLTRDAK